MHIGSVLTASASPPFTLITVFVLIGGALVCVGGRELRTIAWLRRHGIRVPGTVTGRSGGGNGTSAMVFEFVTREGRHVRTRQRVSTNFGLLREGRRVTVAYDPEDPRRAEIVEARATTAGAVLLLTTGSVFFLVGTALGVFSWIARPG
ncbi:DUF3592 domain-containing protein [Marinitenerispora sediminis]|uniref:DUF3592 domain-containing protein n=1 Tax=Marinitenerispora sediminis TaxID=1931232 RepID=UPI001314788C|nr:DUF3592 domain-containing protein [Marinitenerispora sediminis]